VYLATSSSPAHSRLSGFFSGSLTALACTRSAAVSPRRVAVRFMLRERSAVTTRLVQPLDSLSALHVAHDGVHRVRRDDAHAAAARARQHQGATRVNAARIHAARRAAQRAHRRANGREGLIIRQCAARGWFCAERKRRLGAGGAVAPSRGAHLRSVAIASSRRHASLPSGCTV
jgi:hypothetical protein